MPDQLLTIFRLCFLVLLYLFFFRVLRAIWAEINAVPEPVGEAGQKLPRKARKALKKSMDAAPVAPVTPGFEQLPAPTAPPPPQQSTAYARALRTIEPPHLAGIEYPLNDSMTFGRSTNCTVVLDDNFMSGTHLRIAQTPSGWVAEDLNSTNGTYLNRVRFTGSVELTVGDRLQVGNVVMEVTA